MSLASSMEADGMLEDASPSDVDELLEDSVDMSMAEDGNNNFGRREEAVTAPEEQPTPVGESVTGPSGGAEGAKKRTKAKVSCIPCRQAKMRCDRQEQEPDGICTRCRKTNRECALPEYRKPGRVLGAKNKYQGVDRALRQIESGLKHLHRDDTSADGAITRLLNADASTNFSLASSSGGHGDKAASATDGYLSRNSFSTSAQSGGDAFFLDASNPAHSSTASIPLLPSSSSSINSLLNLPENHSSHTDASHQLPPATNPLGLLAEASSSAAAALVLAPPPSSHELPGKINLNQSLTSLEGLLQGPVDPALSNIPIPTETLLRGLSESIAGCTGKGKERHAEYFRPRICSTIRDIGPAFDPMSLALVTEEEAAEFIEYFFRHVHHFVATLDPNLHTLEFIRKRSSFLLTVLLLCGSYWTPGAGAANKRLELHAARLVRLIQQQNFRSLEIVQGLTIYTSWLPPTEHVSDEKLFGLASFALTMAQELGVEKTIESRMRERPDTEPLLMADLEGLDVREHVIVERIIRNRQRAWLRLWLLESSISVTLGRASIFQETPLIRQDLWYSGREAIPEDYLTCAMVHLRRSLASLSAEVKARLQYRPHEGADWITEFMDATLNPWRRRWVGSELSDISGYMLSAYRYGRLCIMSLGLPRLTMGGSPSASAMPSRLAKDAFSSAVEGIVAGIEQLTVSKYFWHHPNQLSPAFAYMSIVALQLWSPSEPMNPVSFVPSQARLLGLVGHLASLLAKVGTTPSHRNGLDAVYARHLFTVVTSHVTRLQSSSYEHEHPNGLGGHMDGSIHEGNQEGRFELSHNDISVGGSGAVTPMFGLESSSLEPFTNWGADWWLTGGGADFADSWLEREGQGSAKSAWS
ncbi:hypothetical protein T439DRAFT_322691 [Meredithblackwellia eburnea MCA 4105]